jgi:hypothetical protein
MAGEGVKAWWIGLLSLLVGCYEPREGCLDVNATNYNVEADRPCPDDCCVYPQLRLNFLHRMVYPDTSVNLVYRDSVYFDGAGNAFRINLIRYYISALHLVRPNGEEVGVTEMLEVKTPRERGDTLVEMVENNFAVINPGDFRPIVLGTTRTQGEFSKIKFTLGIEGAPNRSLPQAFPPNHPLARQDMYFDRDSGYVFNRLELFRVPTPGDTIRSLIRIGTPENLRVVEIPVPFYLDPGFHTRLLFKVDYRRWFRDVDLARDDERVIAAKIVNNLTDAFFLQELTIQRR